MKNQRRSGSSDHDFVHTPDKAPSSAEPAVQMLERSDVCARAWEPALNPVQRRATVGGDAGGADTVHALAEEGTAGTGGSLPHLDPIQQSFGRHDVSGVTAHTDDAAAGAATGMGAEAFATGNHVGFAGTPSLHTAAHEAAHVVQQRAGVQLKGGVGEAGDPHEQQADAVADRVVAGESAEDLLDGAAGGEREGAELEGEETDNGGGELPPLEQVQRKVFVGGEPKTKSFWHGKTGAGDRRVSTMMTDDPERYFKSKDELFAYAKGTTRNIGYVADTWVRLTDKLVVLGEDHSGSKTASAVVAATGTQKYAHESFAEAPAAASPALSGAVEARSAEVRTKKKIAADGLEHQGEDFFPKMIRMLGDIRVKAATVMFESDFGAMALRWAIIYARTAPEATVRGIYDANNAIFDTAEQQLVAGKPKDGAAFVLDASPTNHAALVAFRAAFLEVARGKCAELEASTDQDDLDNFDNRWESDGSGRYGIPGQNPEGKAEADALKNEGDSARDLSMYKHIKKSKAAGHQIYGLGENHRLRMEKLLDSEGIENTTVDDFLASQPKE